MGTAEGKMNEVCTAFQGYRTTNIYLDTRRIYSGMERFVDGSDDRSCRVRNP